MSDAPVDKDRAANVEFALWCEQAEDLADAWASFCHNCGACITQCTAAKFGNGFNPRDIVLKARYGLGGKLLVEESVLWQCFKCYGCYECCPLGLKPVEVIAALRAMLEESVYGVHPRTPRALDPVRDAEHSDL